MPQAVLGGSPVTVVNKAGQQMSIPLDDLAFKSGALDASAWSGWSSPDIDQGQLQHYLNGLAGRGLLRPSPPPPVSPAMTIKALDSGSTGNLIKITIGKVTPNVKPDETTVEMTVELVETYKNLHKADAQDILGKDASTGSRPGLAFTSKKPSSNLDAAANAPFDASGAWSGGNLDLQTRRVAGAGDPAPTAELVKNGTDDVNLTIRWSKTAVAPMKSLNAAFGFLLNIAKSGGEWGVPASGSFNLLGGGDAGAPTTAQSTVPGV